MNVFLTGSSGFVGKNFITYFNNYYKIRTYKRESNISITEEIVVHFAGKAHDLKKTANFKEYYEINTELTKDIFDSFLNSNAKVFIFLSSVKAVADVVDGELIEDHFPNPKTHYGKSKLLAEKYIKSKINVQNKRIYILRPCMIHGPFVIGELIKNENISSGIYNIADDNSLSTNEVIRLISKSINHRPLICRVSKRLIKNLAKLGDIINLPLNSERLKKITESYVVSNKKIKNAIGKELPICSVKGLLETFESFKK